jgi:hypothetical protein
MNQELKMNQEKINFQRCTAAVIISVIFGFVFLMYFHNQYYENISKEAIKAGLVQQKIATGDTIWVKPEDYKPYPLSVWNAPSWSK